MGLKLEHPISGASCTMASLMDEYWVIIESRKSRFGHVCRRPGEVTEYLELHSLTLEEVSIHLIEAAARN